MFAPKHSLPVSANNQLLCWSLSEYPGILLASFHPWNELYIWPLGNFVAFKGCRKFFKIIAVNQIKVYNPEKTRFVELNKTPEEILEIIEERKKAREEKNWAESDRLRDEIIAKGYTVKDSKEGRNIWVSNIQIMTSVSQT